MCVAILIKNKPVGSLEGNFFGAQSQHVGILAQLLHCQRCHWMAVVSVSQAVTLAPQPPGDTITEFSRFIHLARKLQTTVLAHRMIKLDIAL